MSLFPPEVTPHVVLSLNDALTFSEVSVAPFTTLYDTEPVFQFRDNAPNGSSSLCVPMDVVT